MENLWFMEFHFQFPKKIPKIFHNKLRINCEAGNKNAIYSNTCSVSQVREKNHREFEVCSNICHSISDRMLRMFQYQQMYHNRANIRIHNPWVINQHTWSNSLDSVFHTKFLSWTKFVPRHLTEILSMAILISKKSLKSILFSETTGSISQEST